MSLLRKALSFIIPVFLFVHPCPANASVEIYKGELRLPGRSRQFILAAPYEYKKQKLPLVIVLHGGGGRMDRAGRYTGFTNLAKKEKFIAAYPQGYGGQWNDGREIAQSKAHSMKIDDVGFIRELIRFIKAEYNADPDRVYACGISNGGFMSLRLGCELPEIRAIGAVCAGLNPYLIKSCAPGSPVSLIIINGTADPIVPYNGGMVSAARKKRGRVTSTDFTAALWRKYNDIPSAPVSKALIDNEDDGTSVEVFVYKNSKARVALYKIINGGHTWPGALQYMPEKWIGKTSREINAEEVIWDFFKSVM